MDFWTAVVLAVALFVALWVPFFIWQQRRGKAHGTHMVHVVEAARSL